MLRTKIFEKNLDRVSFYRVIIKERVERESSMWWIETVNNNVRYTGGHSMYVFFFVPLLSFDSVEAAIHCFAQVCPFV